MGHKLAGFGDRVVKERPSEQDIAAQGKTEQQAARKLFQAPKNLVTAKINSEAKRGETHSLEHVNFAALQVEQELVYRPRTKETQVHYEQMMHMAQGKLGHAPIETMKAAVDEILAVLKADDLNDGQRKAEIDALLGIERLTDDEFNTMTVLASCLTDYGLARDEAQEKGENAQQADQE